MAESDVAIVPPEISPVDNQTQESAPPSEEAAAAVAAPNNLAEEVDKEVKETQEKEEVEIESEEAAAGEEAKEANQDLKRKLEVQEETERQLEGASNGEDGNEGGEEREGSEAKRQKTETEEAVKSGEALEEEPRGTENLEHDINNNLEQTTEGDMEKDDFSTDKTETEDGSSDTCRKIEVPNHRVGVLIGKAGDTIRNMQKLSGARIQIVKDSDIAPDATTRAVEILGSAESIDKAEQLIRDVLAEADAGRPPPLYGRGSNTSQSSTSEIEMQVPNDKVGSIIGKGGQMIKELQARSGAHILLIPIEASEEEDVKERTVKLSGNKQQVEAAKYMIKDIINQTGRSNSQNRGGPGHRQSYGSRGPGSHGYGSQN
ncbi:far upstream element-binding protein 2-like isoform X2 [Carex littledalei]|uniref:Far upstream element-binding protein 2-like isoform X2 n=1 Tax=Carex littledalei TaxID=544730 RepID=A0A833QM28_9POAL|nr:far upstream element-binding protein 2-like isoform X2 [Carex littledalei]